MKTTNIKNIFLYSFILAVMVTYRVIAGTTALLAYFTNRSWLDVFYDILFFISIFALIFLISILIDFFIKKNCVKGMIYSGFMLLALIFLLFNLRYSILSILPVSLKNIILIDYIKIKSLFLGMKLSGWTALALKGASIVIITVAFFFIIFFLYLKLFKYKKNILIVGFIVSCVIFSNVFHHNAQFTRTNLDEALYNKDITSVAPSTEGIGLPKTIHIILFDGFSYDENILAKNKIDIKKYKNFYKFLSQSYVFQNAKSPGTSTRFSIPQMLTGQRAINEDDVLYTNDKAYIYTKDGRKDLQKVPSIFSLAKEYNNSVYITGCTYGYCNSFKKFNTDCVDYSISSVFLSSFNKQGLLDEFLYRLKIVEASWMSFLRIENKEFFATVPSEYGGAEQVNGYLWALLFKNFVNVYQDFMTNNHNDAIFYTHLNLPHVPVVFSANGKNLFKKPEYMDVNDVDYPYGVSENNQGAYEEQFQYIDHVLGVLLSDIKNTADYDNSLIILTADHAIAPSYLRPSSIEKHHILLAIKTPFQTKRNDINEEFSTLYLKNFLEQFYKLRDEKKVDWFSTQKISSYKVNE